VATCPQGAIAMQAKEVLPDVPHNAIEMQVRMVRERAQLSKAG